MRRSYGDSSAPYLIATAACLLCAGNAGATSDGPSVSLSPYIGSTVWTDDLSVRNQLLYGARVGLNPIPWIGIEGTYGVSNTEAELPTPYDTKIEHFGVDVVFSINPFERIVPYAFGGWGQLRYDSDDANTITGGTPYNFVGFEVGAGLRIAVADQDQIRADIRLDARDVLTDLVQWFPPNRADDDMSFMDTHHDFIFTAGLHFAFGGAPRDTDGDGVPDKRDGCDATPVGALVDRRGCPLDGDNDGVPDGLDVCSDTPRGALVDASGCSTDSDDDGVLDGLDRCPRTPAGARVDRSGCPIDGDGDGVYDGIDTCPGTPPGANVDANGCPEDRDGDGVFDGLDLCPNTPSDLKVDASGCPIEVTETETQLLNTGMIRTSSIRFRSGSFEISPESYPILDEIGRTLVQWPQLRIEVGGHTDSEGASAFNKRLSEQRAQAVFDYLKRSFPEIDGDQFSIQGYGESRPITDNTTRVGRALNRRVEFRVMNQEELKKEIERRRLLRR